MCAFVLSLGDSLGGACGKAGAIFAVQTPGSQRFSMGSSSIFSGVQGVKPAQKCAKKFLVLQWGIGEKANGKREYRTTARSSRSSRSAARKCGDVFVGGE